jgi:acetolactate synthase-1/3 small subunit
VLVDHEPGVLAEVSGLFSRRQFNIESLTVGPTTDDDHARITLVVEEPEPGIEQVEKQLARLVDVIAVSEIAGPAAERELALVKVDGDRPERVRAVTEMVHGTVVDANPEAITVEVTGTSAAVDRAIDALDRFPVREVARTGTTSLARGPEPTTDAESERREELHE